LTLRQHETFCIIPIGFVFRNDWENSENDALKFFRERLLTNFGLRSYYNANDKQKNEKFTFIMNKMRNIGKEGEPEYSDQDIIEEVIETNR